MSRAIVILSAVLFVLCPRGLAWAGSIAILPGSKVSNRVGADAEAGGVPSLPFAAESVAANITGSSAGVYRLDGNQFRITIDQLSTSRNYVGESAGDLFFTASQDAPFRLDATVLGSGGLLAGMRVRLTEMASGRDLFNLADASSLGGLAPLSADGMLEAGQAYALRFDLDSIGGLVSVRGSPSAPYLDSGAVSAELRFNINSVVPVPLPAAIWGGLALLATATGSPLVRRSFRRGRAAKKDSSFPVY